MRLGNLVSALLTGATIFVVATSIGGVLGILAGAVVLVASFVITAKLGYFEPKND